MNLNGKTAVVTGGASGLGEATVRAYVGKGVHVAIFDMDAVRGEALCSELNGSSSYYKVDVTDEASVSTAISILTKTHPEIHICNNFAGIGPAMKTYGKKGPHSLDLFKNVLDINLMGTFNVARLIAEVMAKNQPFTDSGSRGVIINTASVAAFEGQMGQVA